MYTDYQHLVGSFGNKKWITPSAVADHGDSQAMMLGGNRRAFTTFEIGPTLLQNRSGSTGVFGLAVRYKTTTWTAGQVTAAGVFTDDTTDAQSAAAGDFLLHNRADSGSGFLLSADERFNVFSVVQSVAGDQTTPVLVLEYWDGTQWVDIAASTLISNALIGSTGERVVCFPMPFDWVKGGSGTGVPSLRYNLRVRHTHSGAGTVNPQASQVFVGFAVVALEGIVDNGMTLLSGEVPLRFPSSGDALFPLTDQASRSNYVDVAVRLG